MIYGIGCSREIQKDEGYERLFSHIEEIILNIQEGTVRGIMFSVC